jgi:hypothetical protein
MLIPIVPANLLTSYVLINIMVIETIPSAGSGFEILACRCAICNHQSLRDCIELDCNCCNQEHAFALVTKIDTNPIR